MVLSKGIKILGTGSSVPNFEVPNSEFSKIIDTSDEWIVERTGIKTRRFVEEGQSSLTLCVAAAGKAIAEAGIEKEDIALVIVGTCTADYITPSMACLVQGALGLPEKLLAFDLNAACSGFVYSLNTAYMMLQATPDKYALVIGVEVLSRVLDYTDRGSAILFGDGAGAAVVSLSNDSPFIFDSGSIGGADSLNIPMTYGIANPFTGKVADTHAQVVNINGNDVYRFVQDAFPKSAAVVFEKSGITPEEIDFFVCHQANLRILLTSAKKLKVPFDKFFVNIDKYGNTSAASVAIALDELNRSGLLERGHKLMLAGFGGGLTYGSAYLIW